MGRGARFRAIDWVIATWGLTLPIRAQTPLEPPASLEASPIQAPVVAESLVLPANTLVSMELREELSSKHAKPDDFFELWVAEPVFVKGQVVIPAKSRAVGQVIDAKKSGLFGSPAKLLISIRYVELGGKRIAMRFYEPMHGADRTNVALAASIGVGVFAAFIRAGQIVLPTGTLLVAKVAKDSPLQPHLLTPPPTPVRGQPQAPLHEEPSNTPAPAVVDPLLNSHSERPNP